MAAVNFNDIGRVPMEGDNVAIAIKPLEAGTQFVYRDRPLKLSHSMLEGHRFAVAPIATGEFLLSWGLPFGKALSEIKPGDYVANQGMIEALRIRNLPFALPEAANFKEHLEPYLLDEKKFKPGMQVPLYKQPGTFQGFARGGARGVGTRNYVVIMGTTSLTASFATALEARLKSDAKHYENIDGVVAITHTEGGGSDTPHNLDFLLRTLAGFMVNPNVGAVLAVDYGTEVLTNKMVESYLRERGYPIDQVLHRFHSLEKDFAADLDEGERIVRGWFDAVNAFKRGTQPLSALRLALQCGGSDAFSGVSGNPLAGWVAGELVRHGGAANLAETDELMGAEPYVLANVRDLETARKFLKKIEVFRERTAWHGHSAEGNPSGGNKYRGLYNIALKSIGAARKKDPDVRLDHVIDYSEPMTAPGYYFMDSPGNDLESMAGQVAAQCNILIFTTGNGSITNFPFVPTIKIMTNTRRFELLSKDMDVNAGRYQDGTPMDELGRETFDYMVRVASGLRSVGERAGHAQVSIWREWRQTNASRLDALQHLPVPDGKPVPVPRAKASDAHFQAMLTVRGYATDQVGLIVPTSLCSGQIARKIADDLNAKHFAAGRNVSRFVALVHTEGCGSSSGENEEHYTRTVVGHLVHPFVKEALLLEHGCERTHNDAMRHVMKELGVDMGRFGYASVQLDGGIDKVVDKVERWFAEKLPAAAPAERKQVGLQALSLGLLSVRTLSEPVARALARLAAGIVGAGGTVVIPENATLLKSADFLEEMAWEGAPVPSLAYGQVATAPGMHIMATPTDHIVETLTGLGGTGVQLVLAHVEGPPLQGHPMIPLVQVTTDAKTARMFHKDLDRVIETAKRGPDQIGAEMLHLVCDTASHTYQPKLWTQGNTDFQVTRGYLGVSL